MEKQFWIAIVSIFILSATAVQAQWRITTTSGNEYIGVFISDDKDSLSLRTLDNIDVRICQDSIKTTEKMKTKIKTKRNEVFIGHVKNINKKELTLLTDGAGEITIPMSFVLKMTAVNNDVSDYCPDYYKVQVESESEIEGRYYMLGAIIGFPSIVGILCGYQGEKNGFRINGMVLENEVFMRLNLLRNIGKYKNFEHNISLGVGIIKSYIVFSPVEITYLGLWYDLNFRGIFLETGVVFSGDGWSPSVLPSLHIGYVYRFN